MAQKVQIGMFGDNSAAPLVESRRSNLEKIPWKNLPSLRHNVESTFIRPVCLGESIAPYRLLSPDFAVIPWDETNDRLLSAKTAQIQGYTYLTGWLMEAEKLWAKHGSGRRSLAEQLDYYGQLSAQFPISPIRVVYSKAGTLPAAAIVKDGLSIIDHSLYWMKIDTEQEGHYLLAILNSETARQMAEHLQSRGQWGARHFDKVILSLPIPKFNESNKQHIALSKAAAHAEEIAADVQLAGGMHFITARQKIRAALHEDGIAQKIDKLVAELLKAS